MEIKINENQTLLVWWKNTVIAAIASPVSTYKIETAIGEYGNYEETHLMEQEININFATQYNCELSIGVTIKPDQHPENDYTESVKLTVVTIY